MNTVKTLAKFNMIHQQLRPSNVVNNNILELFNNINRHEFVPQSYCEFAYSDMSIPLAHEQQMLTPIEEGMLLQALQLRGNESILEIGTGSGYLTVLLSKLAKKVVSVDYFVDFTMNVQNQLSVFDCNNVTLLTGDASYGWFELAPYDIIVITGGLPEINEALRLQLFPGGKIFAIIGVGAIQYGTLLELDHNNHWVKTQLFATNTPLLFNKFKVAEFVF